MKAILSRLTIILPLLLITLLGCKTQSAISHDEISAKEKAINPVEYQQSKTITFLQPFNLFFRNNDFHVMLHFNGHPEYEAVEAMIKMRQGKEPLIRAIITRHDQTQIDHINDQKVVEERKAFSKNKREIFYTPIQMYRTVENEKPRVFLEFNSFKGESLVFDLYAVAKPKAKYGGLTDPERHAQENSLPIMWRDKSTLASPKSKITFDGKNYKIPVKIWVPPFFIGMKGYYSEGFKIGVITIGKANLELIKAPEKLEVGEEWIYRTGKDELEYTITEIDTNTIIIQKISKFPEIIQARVADGYLEIEEIKMISYSTKKGQFVIKFNPPLPDITAMSGEQGIVSKFAISIDDHQALITGEMSVHNESGKIFLTLNPEQPDWATKRAIRISINRKDKEYHLKSTIKYKE